MIAVLSQEPLSISRRTVLLLVLLMGCGSVLAGRGPQIHASCCSSTWRHPACMMLQLSWISCASPPCTRSESSCTAR